MDINKKIVKEASFVFAGQLYFMAANFALIMLLTRLLSPEDFGKFILAQTVIGTLAILGTFGLDKALTRYVAYYKGLENWAAVKGVARKIGLRTIALNSALGVAVFIAAYYLGDQLFRKSGLGIIIALLAISYPFQAVAANVSGFYCGLKELRYTTILDNVAMPSLKIALAFSLFAFSEYLLLSWVYGLLFLYMINGCIALYILFSQCPSEIRAVKPLQTGSKEVYEFAVPIFFSSILVIGINNFDVLMLGYFGVIREVGVYRVYKIMATLLLSAISALAMIYQPTLTELVARRDSKLAGALYGRITKWYQLISVIGFVCILTLGPELGKVLFGGQYALSDPVLVLILVGGPFFCGMVGPTSMTLLAYGHTRLIMLNSTAAFLAMLTCGYLLIPLHGMNGAAAATLVCFIVNDTLAAIEVYRLKGFHPLPNSSILFIVCSLVTVAVLIASVIAFSGNNAPLYQLVSLIAVIAFIISLFFSNIFDDEDRRIFSLIVHKLSPKGLKGT
jgi:O-antigen/teichoic acid export membrane protein